MLESALEQARLGDEGGYPVPISAIRPHHRTANSSSAPCEVEPLAENGHSEVRFAVDYFSNPTSESHQTANRSTCNCSPRRLLLRHVHNAAVALLRSTEVANGIGES